MMFVYVVAYRPFLRRISVFVMDLESLECVLGSVLVNTVKSRPLDEVDSV